MNQIAWQIFGGTKAKANTFIGGVASTITTSGALATKLAIASNRITNFKIVGSNIECRISGSYVMTENCWNGDTSIIYYYDKDGLVSNLLNFSFANTPNLKRLEFKGVINLTGGYIVRYDVLTSRKIEVFLDNCISITSVAFYDGYYHNLLIYAPRVTVLGASPSVNNNVFYRVKTGSTLYLNPFLQTSNAGAEEADVAYTRGLGTTIRYVTNFTAPNPITNLSVGTIYGTAVQLNFTAPSSTNAIEFYEVYVNGVYKNNISGSGSYATGLSLNTAYTIEVKPVDIFYNKSTSNVVSATTANAPVAPFTDVDANAYISAATLTGIEQQSAYQLITDLKTAGLWTKIQAIYPFKGTTAAQHKFNAKNPLDTDAAFRLVFGGTGTYSNLGFQCNGTNAYANTKLIPSANQNVNSNGLTLVCGTNNATANPDITDMAVYQSETQISLLTLKGRNTDFYKETLLNNRASSVKSVGVNDAKGILTGVRQSVNVTKLFKGGFLLGSSSSAGGSLCTIPIYIGGINVSNSPSAFSNQRIQIAIIHEGLSDAEVATLHAIIDTSEAIAGRKTW